MAHTSVFILTPDFPAVDSCAMIGDSYEEAIAAEKRMGYDGVEITMGDPALFDAGAFQAAGVFSHSVQDKTMKAIAGPRVATSQGFQDH